MGIFDAIAKGAVDKDRCKHNYIRIAKSTRRIAPYWFCSKCGDIRETMT